MPVHPYLEFVCALIGLVAGSAIIFFAPRLVAYRLPEPIAFPPLTVLIPIAGVVRERWRVRTSIAVEAMTALVLVMLAVHYGARIELLITGAYSIVFIAIGFIDIDHRLVLNRVSYPAILLAFPVALIWPSHGVLNALIGAGVGGLFFLALQIIGRGRLGTGDTKLAILIGAVQGFPGVFNALLIGMVLGGIGGVLLMVVLRRSRKDYFAYAPYLAAGAIVTFVTGLA